MEENNYTELARAAIQDLNEVSSHDYRYCSATLKLCTARAKEGAVLDDFRQVHRRKFVEWGNDPTWSKYLRPETLYGSKFWTYRGQRGVEDTPVRANGRLDQLIYWLERVYRAERRPLPAHVELKHMAASWAPALEKLTDAALDAAFERAIVTAGEPSTRADRFDRRVILADVLEAHRQNLRAQSTPSPRFNEDEKMPTETARHLHVLIARGRFQEAVQLVQAMPAPPAQCAACGDSGIVTRTVQTRGLPQEYAFRCGGCKIGQQRVGLPCLTEYEKHEKDKEGRSQPHAGYFARPAR